MGWTSFSYCGERPVSPPSVHPFLYSWSSISLFLIQKCICSLNSSLNWLWHLTSSLINELHKIFNKCSLYICRRAIILSFWEIYSSIKCVKRILKMFYIVLCHISKKIQRKFCCFYFSYVSVPRMTLKWPNHMWITGDDTQFQSFRKRTLPNWFHCLQILLLQSRLHNFAKVIF